MAVDGMHGEQGEDFAGRNKEVPEQDAGLSWFDGVLSSGCP